jgi:clan AA aspartic protease
MTAVREDLPQPANRVKQYWGDRPMGEVRARVRFTNAFDVIRFEQDEVRQVEVDALVDTGAVQTVIPQAVADALGVGIHRHRQVNYADGRTELVGVTNPLFAEIMERDTAEECLILGNEVLIGQTILEKTDLLVDCANARLVPNPDHPEGPVMRV